MAEVLGPMTIVQRALPTGVDGTKIAEWRLREGVSVAEFFSMVGTAMGGVNQQWVRDWGWLFSITEADVMEYPDGGSVTELPEITDITDPDMVAGTTIGHMLDLRPYGSSVGGSWRYFRDARQSQIQATLATIINRAKWRFEKKVLTRALTQAENAIGSAGYDVPFVRGTGGNIDFTPPGYSGQSFTTSHNHFLGFDSGSSKTMADVLNGLAATVEEHGHKAPFVAAVSRADVALFRALTKFVQFIAPIVTTIDRGGESSGNQLYANGQPMVSDGVFGYFQSDYGLIELRAYYRIPTGYVGLYKSYGNLAAQNPLAVRVHPQQGFGLFLTGERSDNEKFPLKKINVELEFGVGVGMDRTNGAVGYLVSGGTYTDPTIS